jgi:hypothetical protein
MRRVFSASALSSLRGTPPAAIVSRGQRRVVHLYLNDGVELLALGGQELIERGRLFQRPREAIENEAVGAVGLGDPLGDDLDHHFVGD